MEPDLILSDMADLGRVAEAEGRKDAGEPAPEAPNAAVLQILRELKGGRFQGDNWDSALEEPAFTDKAGRRYQFLLVANRIRSLSAICAECLKDETHKHLNTQHCAVYRHSVDIVKSLETGNLVPKVERCPLVEDAVTVAYQTAFLKEVGLDPNTRDAYLLDTMVEPTVCAPGYTRPVAVMVFDNAKKFCGKYITDPKGHWLYLHSSLNGNGKTRFAIATALGFIATHKRPARYINASVFFSQYKGMLGQDDGFEAFTLLPEVSAFPGLLVVDDYGKEVPSERFEQMMYDIIYTRDIQDLPTVFTSNRPVVGAGSLKNHLSTDRGSAIISRIIGKTNRGYIVTLDGLPDRRDTARKAEKALEAEKGTTDGTQ